MIELLSKPWHWSVAGAIIGLIVPILLLLGNRVFGISSNLRHICAACFPAGIDFFKYDWKKEAWNLFFVGGAFVGAVIASTVLRDPSGFQIADATRSDLSQLGVQDFSAMMPDDLFGIAHVLSLKGFIFLVLGGFLVGFGTRYGGGCTSGHAISGLSNLQWPSLVATISFMAGGFIMTHFGLPLIFKLF
ncbi:MAG: YeeE/YedE family protein [Bacteroidetes bacterium]|nr:YeeE/YedE family protein [Bacteroidota bacterium]